MVAGLAGAPGGGWRRSGRVFRATLPNHAASKNQVAPKAPRVGAMPTIVFGVVSTAYDQHVEAALLPHRSDDIATVSSMTTITGVEMGVLVIVPILIHPPAAL